jgi:hypothetical protein
MEYTEDGWNRKLRIYAEQSKRQRKAVGDKKWTMRPAGEFFQNNWEPDWTCDFEQRLGSAGDGGKWVW